MNERIVPPAVDPGFVHLHVHTSYSLREGALTIAKLAKLAAYDRMPALAITDTNNMFGALEFSEKLAKEGVQPIVGLHVAVDFGDAAGLGGRFDTMRVGRGALVLIAQSERGYGSLMRVASQAFLDPQAGDPAGLAFSRLLESRDGLIALTGGPSGPLDTLVRLGRPEAAEARLARLIETFGGDQVYVELQRHGLDEERQTEPQLIDLAYRRDIRLVATNEPFFASLSDHEAHDALICIAEGAAVGTPDRRRLSPEHRFKTRTEMVALFADVPEATANTLEIAQRCAYRPTTRKPILPNYTMLDGSPLDAVAALRGQAEAGLMMRLATVGLAPGFVKDDYQERLAFELDTIVGMQFPGYFLIVSDFIKWAKAQAIPVGPGRGSGAGSLVAYALTITDLDPMRFGLLFERFLNPERISMPDFDIDFCQDRRDEVIAYVRERYGRDRVAQIITFGSFLARGVLRNVGRVLEMSFTQVDKLAKLIPQNPANPVTLAQAIEGEPKLREAAESDPRVDRLLKIAGALEGLYSNASTHAAGIVIGDRPLHELVPLYRDPRSDMPATQFNMKWVEPAGLVKFDFLGLKTLTVLTSCVKLIAQKGVALDLATIPLDDKKTFDMLGRGETVGVFQVESGGMRKALVDMRADRFEDIIALVALYRPGPMANIPVYCARKLGEELPEYIHEKLEPILRETFGVIIYQEQVMQAAQVLSGYSLGEADMLRRAMGKKIKAEMDAQRARFVEGCVAGGIPKNKADEIFDLLAKFADYGFNKSHAAAYALISYQTAYLKANHPVEFIAASMTLEKSNTDKLAEFRNEAVRLGIAVEPPSVNHSGVDFNVAADSKRSIRYALSAIKGAGEGQVRSIVGSRGSRPFTSLEDFARRLKPRDVNRKVLETLVAAGAFDLIEPDRARAMVAVEPMLALANRVEDERLAGQAALFGHSEGAGELNMPPAPAWSVAQRLRREFDAVGFFLSGHPLDEYKDVLARLGTKPWAQFVRAAKAGDSTARIAATVLDRQERRTKSGNKIGIVEMSDPSGQFEAILFSEALNEYRDVLDKGTAVLVTIQASAEGDEIRARILTAERLDEAATKVQKGLRISVAHEEALPSIVSCLSRRGDREVSIVVKLDGERRAEVKLRERFQVTAEIASQLKATAGVLAVEKSLSRPAEDDLIARFFAPIAGEGGLGLKDDAALIRPAIGTDLVVSVDALVAGGHFFADDPPASIAAKALGVNLSDLAAKGADPLGFVLALALPADWSATWLELFAAGLGTTASAARCPLLGGDTVQTSGPLTISITVFGSVPRGRMVPRTGAENGDRLYVSGTIGDAALGLLARRGDPVAQALSTTARAKLIDRYRTPRPRLALAPALREHAHAAMDISDGLAGDAAKMLRVSEVSGVLDLRQVPLSASARAFVDIEPDLLSTAVTGGDDYEILAAVPLSVCAAFEAAAKRAKVAVTAIGEVTAGTDAMLVLDLEGKPATFARASFSHF